MGMEFALYSVIILVIRWAFYLSPRKKRIGLYAIKAAVEIAAFLLCYKSPMPIEIAIAAVLVVLNLFCYAIEVKVADANKRELLTLEPFTGLAVYAAAFFFIFGSGRIAGFSRPLEGWLAAGPALSNLRILVAVAAGFLIVSESEHLFRYFRITFATKSAAGTGENGPAHRTNVIAVNGAYQAAGYAERTAVLLLILISQFTAAGIIVAGRLVSAGWPEDRRNYVSLTMLSLTWALAWALFLRLFT